MHLTFLGFEFAADQAALTTLATLLASPAGLAFGVAVCALVAWVAWVQSRRPPPP